MDLSGDFRTGTLLSDILKRLPVKSLVRFMSVSKPWSHRIRDPNFVTNHLQFNKSSSSSSSVLGINFRHYPQFEYFRIDHTHKTTLEHLNTPFLWRLKPDPKPEPRLVGSSTAIRGHCNGLILAFESRIFLVGDSKIYKANRISVDRYILCNPISRRFSILPESTIEPPDLNLEVGLEAYDEYKKLNAIGLGFIDDVVYKVVRVTYGMAQVSLIYRDVYGFKPYDPPFIEAYDSRSCYWRRIPMNSGFSYEYLNDGVFNSFDGCLYWLGRGYGNRDKYSILVSFHLVDETWHEETLLPYKDLYDHEDREEGAFDGYGFCQFVKVLGGSVVLLVGDRRNKLLCNVWKMNKEEDKVSWTHMWRLNFGGCPLGFIRDGVLLLMKYSRWVEDPRRVFTGDSELFGLESYPKENDGKFVLHDLTKKNNACYGFTDLDFEVGNVVPDFVESLVLLDGESGFIEDVSEETIEEEEFGKFSSIFDDPEEQDFGGFSSMFDEPEEEDFGDRSTMFDDNFERIS